MSGTMQPPSVFWTQVAFEWYLYRVTWDLMFVDEFTWKPISFTLVRSPLDRTAGLAFPTLRNASVSSTDPRFTICSLYHSCWISVINIEGPALPAARNPRPVVTLLLFRWTWKRFGFTASHTCEVHACAYFHLCLAVKSTASAEALKTCQYNASLTSQGTLVVSCAYPIWFLALSPPVCLWLIL